MAIRGFGSDVVLKGRGKRLNLAVKIIKRTTLFLAVLFILFSIAPYLVATEEALITREELAFSNSEFIEVNGVELHYREWPALNKIDKNVLLVHGLGASTFTWRYTAPVLQEKGFRVVAVDLPGFGLSERRTGLDHSAGVRGEMVWDMLEELMPGAQWNLIGHSMGGATVTAMALQRPEQTESLTLAAGALVPAEPSPYMFLLQYPPVGQWAKIYSSRLVADESRIEELLASAYGQQPAEHEVTGYYLPLNIENTAATWPDLLRTAQDPLLDYLDRLEMPVLCIWGEDDRWIPLEQGKQIDRRLPNSKLLVMENEGHCPMETAPDRFDRKVADFLLGF